MFCQAIFRNSLRNVGPINNVRRWIEFLCELCMSVDMKKSTKTALKWTKWYLTKNRSRPISWSADHARRCSTWKLPPASKDDGDCNYNILYCRLWQGATLTSVLNCWNFILTLWWNQSNLSEFKTKLMAESNLILLSFCWSSNRYYTSGIDRQSSKYYI